MTTVARRRVAQRANEAVFDASEDDVLGHPRRLLQHAADRRHRRTREVGIALRQLLERLAAEDDDLSVAFDLEHRGLVDRQRVAGVEGEQGQLLAVEGGEAPESAAAHDDQPFLDGLFFVGAVDELPGLDSPDGDQARVPPSQDPVDDLRQGQIFGRLHGGGLGGRPAAMDARPRLQASVEDLAFLRLNDAVVRRRIVADLGVLEREQLVEAEGAARRPVESKQRDSVSVGADQAIALKRQAPLVRAADQIGIGVEVHLFAVAELGVEQRPLDLLRGAVHQRHRQRLRLIGGVGEVQHAGDRAVGIEDRRRRAAEDAVGFEEMLAADHRDRLALRQHRADRVRAGRLLLPGGAGLQRDPRRLFGEFALAKATEDKPVRIGEDDDDAGEAGVATQRLHLAARRPHQDFIALLRLAQLLLRQQIEARPRSHVQAERETALP